MGCHICQDEVFGFFAVLAVFKFIPGYMRAAWANRHKKPVCHHDHEHAEPVTEDMIVSDEEAP
jgi:peptide methionine sulfoxide reductase MsrA